MKAIEVLVNGKRLCIAGSGSPEHTWAILTLYDLDELKVDLSVAGSRGKMVAIWTGDQILKESDEVLLRIVDVEEADPPVVTAPKWTEFPRVKLDE